MRVQAAISPNFGAVSSQTNFLEKKKVDILRSNYVDFAPISMTSANFSNINFCGKNNKDEAIYVGAELPPYWKKGGVATVMNDYPGPHIIPYYNGKIEYDPKTGIPVKNSRVQVHRLSDGTPISTNADLREQTIEEVIAKNNFYRLKQVSSKTMHWGLDTADEIVLYKVLPKESDMLAAQAKGIKLPEPEHYMVYTDATAKMPGPYADGSYSFGLKSALGSDVGMWQGDPYAKFGKATAELIPSIKGINPETIVLSDSQSAYVSHWMAVKTMKGDEYYQNVKPSYVEHNVSLGYTGATNSRNMFVNLADSAEQVRAVSESPEYISALKEGTTEDFFRKFVPETLDAFEHPSATMIPLRYCEQDYVSAVTTVSEKYADAIATNPMVAPEIYPMHAKLRKSGKGGGILNPLNDPKVDAYKPIPLPGYSTEQKITINGVEETVPAMKMYTPDMTLEKMLDTKRENKINLFKRLSGKYTQSEILTGLSGKKVELLGNISPSMVEAIEHGQDVKLFVSWGRGDFQKGLDLVLASFERFAKTEEGKNAVLILGGELDMSNPEAKGIKAKAKALLSDPAIKGRLCFMDGFAPGYALASASDAAVFPSRQAPCELTDLESKKYFSTTIVTNAQGLAQKNFDPRIEGEKKIADAYKTTHEFQMGYDELAKISPEFKSGYEAILNAERLALRKHGVEEALIEELVMKDIYRNDKITILYREHADNILVNELFEAMHQRVSSQTGEVSEIIYQNHKNLKTGWDNNGALHPSGKTSRQLYKELHFAPDPKRPIKSLFNFDNGIIEKYKAAIEKNVSGVKSTAETAAKSGMGKGAIAAIAIGGVALLGGAMYLFNKKSAENKNSGTGEPLQTVSSNKYNKARLKVG